MNVNDLSARFATVQQLRQQDPSVEWHQVAEQDSVWSPALARRIQHQLIDNIDCIRNQRVFDVSCGDGIITEAMCQLGASWVTATEVRPQVIEQTRQALADAGHTQVTIEKVTVYDVNHLQQLSFGHDTVHLGSVLFHVNNHFELLHAVSGHAQHIIIDTKVQPASWHSPEPLIVWHQESNSVGMFGWDHKTDTTGQCFVGLPNLAWCRTALELLGWRLRTVKYYQYAHFQHRVQRKCVITAVKL